MLERSDRRPHLIQSRVLLGSLLEHLDVLTKTMREMHAGYPSGHEGGGQFYVCPTCEGSGTTADEGELAQVCSDCEGRCWVSDDMQSRTESAALTPDAARNDLAELDKLIPQIRALCDKAAGIQEKWLVTFHGKKAGEREDGCTSCARLRVMIHGRMVPMWEPRHLLSGNGDKAHYDERCRWCSDWFLAEGQNPPVEILKLRHQGTRITTAVLLKHGVKTKQTARERQGRKAS